MEFELLLILGLIFVLFGPGKLSSVMEDLGKGVKSFRKGLETDSDKQDSKE